MRFAILTMIFLATASLNACNTFDGMGKDVQKGGQDLSDTAEKNK